MEQESYHQIQHEAPMHPAPTTKAKRPYKSKTGRKATPAQAEAGKRNIKPSQPGEVRNPYGRWGKAGRKNNLKAILDSILFQDGEVSTKAEQVMQVLIQQASEGNMRAIEIILERIDGKVADKVQVESTDPLACMVLPVKRPREGDES